MATLKTIGVFLLVALVLFLIFKVVGFIATAFFGIIEFLILVALVAVVYHHFKRQRTSKHSD